MITCGAVTWRHTVTSLPAPQPKYEEADERVYGVNIQQNWISRAVRGLSQKRRGREKQKDKTRITNFFSPGVNQMNKQSFLCAMYCFCVANFSSHMQIYDTSYTHYWLAWRELRMKSTFACGHDSRCSVRARSRRWNVAPQGHTIRSKCSQVPGSWWNG